MITLYSREITKYDDIIDSCDVIERIEELESAQAMVAEDPQEFEFTEEDTAELATLRALAEDGETLADWQYGVALIRDSYFVDYAKSYAEDVIADMDDARWPFTHIDWEAAADDLQTDYTDITFDGVTYWAR